MKTLKSLFGLGIVIGGFYLAWLLIPPYFNNYQLQDALETEARLAQYAYGKSEADVQSAVVAKAREFDIQLQPEQVKVSRQGIIMEISAEYTIHVDIPLYPVDLKFNPTSRNKRT